MSAVSFGKISGQSHGEKENGHQRPPTCFARDPGRICGRRSEGSEAAPKRRPWGRGGEGHPFSSPGPSSARSRSHSAMRARATSPKSRGFRAGREVEKRPGGVAMGTHMAPMSKDSSSQSGHGLEMTVRRSYRPAAPPVGARGVPSGLAWAAIGHDGSGDVAVHLERLIEGKQKSGGAVESRDGGANQPGGGEPRWTDSLGASSASASRRKSSA